VGIVIGMQSPEGGSLPCASEICHWLWYLMAVVTRTCGQHSDKGADGVLMFETDVANAADEGMVCYSDACIVVVGVRPVGRHVC